MPAWKRILLHILYPGKFLTWLITICGFSLLAAVFYNGWENTALAYISYVFAFYSLLLSVLNIVPAISKGVLAYRRHRKEKPPLPGQSLRRSLTINILYSIFQLLSGFYYRSVWFFSNGIYYLILSLIRLLLVRYEKEASECTDIRQKQRIGWNGFLCCGILMFFLNFAMAGMVVQFIWFGQGSNYHEFMVYAVAAYTFYRLTRSILRVIRQKGKHDPLEGAVSNISLTAAIMSLYSLQVTMLNVFADTQQLRFLFNTISGTAVCLLTILGALGTVVHGCKQKKQISSQM